MDTSEWNKEFTVTSISRTDFRQLGFTEERIAQLTDEEMQQIARKMADLYADNGYWEDLELAAVLVLSQYQDEQTTEKE